MPPPAADDNHAPAWAGRRLGGHARPRTPTAASRTASTAVTTASAWLSPRMLGWVAPATITTKPWRGRAAGWSRLGPPSPEKRAAGATTATGRGGAIRPLAPASAEGAHHLLASAGGQKISRGAAQTR